MLQTLWHRFKSPDYRHAYAETFLLGSVATQIKVLREQRHLSQAELAAKAGLKQSQVSRLEDVDNASLTVRTLLKLARALDLALIIRFERFSRLANEAPHFGRAWLERPSYDDDRIDVPQPVDLAAWIRADSQEPTTATAAAHGPVASTTVPYGQAQQAPAA